MKKKNILVQLIIAILIIVLGFIVMKVLAGHKKPIKKTRPPETVTLVKTMNISTGPQQILISGEGIVKPLKEIQIVPQVSGKVMFVSPDLVNGGEFNKGDILIRIDPSDYKLSVTLARARVKTAESNLMLSKESAAAAKDEWNLHNSGNSEKSDEPSDLVLKKPQLLAAEAALEAEKANHEKAKLSLERTVIKAPFNGRVSMETIDTGQFLLTGQPVASIYSIETAEIIIPIEVEKLEWFHVPGFTDGTTPGASAVIQTSIAGKNMKWNGTIVRSEGKLDVRTRMINIVVRVNNPYKNKPPLAPGLFVKAEIYGKTIQNAAIIPNSYLHENNNVWVLENNSLMFRKINIAYTMGNNLVVNSGLKDGEKLIITPLQDATNGMTVGIVQKKEK